MSRLIKIVLFSLIVLLLIIFYKIYLDEKNLIVQNINTNPTIQKETLKDNLIHNLTYSVNLGQNNEYIINSELSEITYKNDSTEIVNMQGVSATIIDKNELSIMIKSDLAEYDNFDYGTLFKKNVRINYLNHEISSNEMQLDFKNKLIKIYDKVEYNGPLGQMFTSNIDIDINNNKIEIYMDNNANLVEFFLTN
jgi:hypothetical protein